MFPYPSGAGLHVGHPEGYTATDILSRYKAMKGFEVLHPMGWDAFGLPAENYAIKTGVHPAKSTQENISTFRRQIRSFGFRYDWDLEIDTSSPDYYRWTQWLFLQLYKHGLAYRKEARVNWCEQCKTVLANEQVENGRCERCKQEVVQKMLKQWFFSITKYAQRLLDDLDVLDWPDSIKEMQRNWIGRSDGAVLTFLLDGHDIDVSVFTTRPDTLMGATYLVLAPEHSAVLDIVTDAQHDAVVAYQRSAQAKTQLERSSLQKEKTGVFTGAFAIHPITGDRIPVWVADYVLDTVGTGAVMAVPAHDERDYAFAKEYDLPIREVVTGGDISAEAYVGDGLLVNSGKYDGESNRDVVDHIVRDASGTKEVNYRLRDWLVSRQRYWGAPIPIIYCDSCGEVPVPEDDLPVRLPTDVDFLPTGESPLALSNEFHDVVCPSCGEREHVRRDNDTMDTFVDSSWYFLRYPFANEDSKPFDSDVLKEWLPVDMYVGGAEHAVLHLLYARFVTKFLIDHDYLAIARNGAPYPEPFASLRNQGMILAEDGRKMSKSLGNVVNPDDIVAEFGADAFRLYEMFMGPLEDPKPWNTRSIAGVYRFLGKVQSQVGDRLDALRVVADGDGASNAHSDDRGSSQDVYRELHRLIQKVGDDIEELRFNTAIAAMMQFVKEGYLARVDREQLADFLVLLAPFAPHLCEELWAHLHGYVDDAGSLVGTWSATDSVSRAAWPSVDTSQLVDDTVQIVVQVNGKVRARFSASTDADDAELRRLALAHEQVQRWTEGRDVHKVIVVPSKLVNIVIR